MPSDLLPWVTNGTCVFGPAAKSANLAGREVRSHVITFHNRGTS
ncbi:MAG: hypothetical protein ACO3JL_07110 [Myxococcota bacterium]